MSCKHCTMSRHIGPMWDAGEPKLNACDGEAEIEHEGSSWNLVMTERDREEYIVQFTPIRFCPWCGQDLREARDD